MDIETGALAVLILGFLLGLKHATDADHVVAVSTIVTEQRNIWRGLWIGASWGAGHSTPLLILGLVILVLKDLVLDQYEAVAPFLEFGVGIMLVYLGASVVWNIWRGKVHIHRHTHDAPHVHIHATHEARSGHGSADDSPSDRHNSFYAFGKPVFRVKSYVIGIVHGLAGSAAVMLALLPTIDSFLTGVGYLVLFSVGTMLSMAVVTVVLAVPFVATGGNMMLNRSVGVVAGALSAVIGVAVMSEIVLDVTIIPF